MVKKDKEDRKRVFFQDHLEAWSATRKVAGIPVQVPPGVDLASTSDEADYRVGHFGDIAALLDNTDLTFAPEVQVVLVLTTTGGFEPAKWPHKLIVDPSSLKRRFVFFARRCRALEDDPACLSAFCSISEQDALGIIQVGGRAASPPLRKLLCETQTVEVLSALFILCQGYLAARMAQEPSVLNLAPAGTALRRSLEEMLKVSSTLITSDRVSQVQEEVCSRVYWSVLGDPGSLLDRVNQEWESGSETTDSSRVNRLVLRIVAPQMLGESSCVPREQTADVVDAFDALLERLGSRT